MLAPPLSAGHCGEALFQSLYLHDKWDWQRRFPVIHISFNDGGLNTAADLERRIQSILRVNFARMGLPFPNLPDNIDLLGELIRGARAKFGERVVILVDEYDKPILDNLHDNRHITRMTCCYCLMPPFSISKTVIFAFCDSRDGGDDEDTGCEVFCATLVCLRQSQCKLPWFVKLHCIRCIFQCQCAGGFSGLKLFSSRVRFMVLALQD